MTQPRYLKSTRDGTPKCDRALHLHERGLSHEAIGLRLNIRIRLVSTVLKQARERRARAAEKLLGIPALGFSK